MSLIIVAYEFCEIRLCHVKNDCGIDFSLRWFIGNQRESDLRRDETLLGTKEQSL